jgi:hypothetical protein
MRTAATQTCYFAISRPRRRFDPNDFIFRTTGRTKELRGHRERCRFRTCHGPEIVTESVEKNYPLDWADLTFQQRSI